VGVVLTVAVLGRPATTRGPPRPPRLGSPGATTLHLLHLA